MNVDVDYVSVMSNLGFDIRKKHGKHLCPICFTRSFVIYPDSPNEMGVCHSKTCKWSGDAVKLYGDIKKISYNEAMGELGIAFREGFIRLKEQAPTEKTYAEAKKEFAKDLEFLTKVRMYEGFNPDYTRENVIRKLGIASGTLSKIINGKMSKAATWRKVMNALRLDLEPRIKMMERAMSLGTKYFEDLIDEEQRGKDVEKLRVKKQRRPRVKIADKE